MKTHLLALLQDNCLDLVRCAFLHKCCIGLSLAHCRKLSCLTAVRVDIDYSMQMLIISTLQGVSQDRSWDNEVSSVFPWDGAPEKN